MSQSGIVIRQDSPVARGKAKKLGLELIISAGWELPWARTLFLGGEYTVPWDLVPAGFQFLQRWDAAAPLWRQGVLASGLGTPAEREQTLAVCLDLRIPPYEPGLLFVRNSPAGRALVETWRAQCAGGRDERLAFLRALHRVKPTFCVLPTSWLAEEAQRARQQATRPAKPKGGALVRLEISPGRFVKCYAGDEQKVLAQMHDRMKRRHG